MNQSIYNSWLVGWVLKKIDKDVKTGGMIETMHRLTDSMVKLVVKNREKVKLTLKNEPVILISNHPSQVEVLILLGLLEKRDDAYLIADHSFLEILPSVDKHIIPVYINHRLDGKQKDSWKFNLLTRFHQSESFCREIAHKKNIASINLATDKVNNGGLVMIFPAAGELGGKFLSGLGYMIKNLKNPKKVKIVMVHVRGTSTWDYLRLIPIVRNFLPKVYITFAEPIPAGQFLAPEAKAISENVEKRYYEWVRGNSDNT
ncbi:MAG: 1-acyl-sn-glycerol-3-phosphate acyltransferase [Candidatus Shapirobacteria bacterium]|nr:1-acyl-sn-glycerol-3-phosphate acyltransferase [Candidatus Shapirobacteria bacterium]